MLSKNEKLCHDRKIVSGVKGSVPIYRFPVQKKLCQEYLIFYIKRYLFVFLKNVVLENSILTLPTFPIFVFVCLIQKLIVKLKHKISYDFHYNPIIQIVII